jgi:hypothetical protein
MKVLWAAVAALVVSGAQAETWQKVLTCDGGAAVVDADSDNPAHLQIVVRDPNIVSYFNKSGVGSSPGMPSSATEVIRSGNNDIPVHDGGDVHAFSESYQDSYSTYQNAYIWREGGGIKIKFESQHMGCPADCRENPLSMQCESLCVGANVGGRWEMANWYFRDCR